MILVTGGAGYIGSHTAKALRQSGFQPLVFDNFSTGHRDFVRDIPHVEGDLRSPDDLARVFRDHDIAGVLHFAGKALVPESHQHPGLYYETNVAGGLNLLHAMKTAGTKHIIFSSTCATYGIPKTVPITEASDQRPINPYGETKLAFERALRWFHEAHGIGYLSLRYFNAAGADFEGEFGEDHVPETHLIPLIFDAALGRKEEVKIFGTNYPTPDGTCVRDYIHVNDLAKAHVLGLQKLMKGLEPQALNLGTGAGYSVRQVIQAVQTVTGTNFKIREVDRREGDPPFLVAAVDRARERLGWSAEASDIEKIIASAWNWHHRRFRRNP
jgi:UDP-glucose-4-epimerase GalE